MPYKDRFKRLAHQKIFQKKVTQRNINYVLNYKKDKSCAFCGWNEHPEILTFHHTGESEKKRGITYFIHGGNSLETLNKEISKCILLCPNCHF